MKRLNALGHLALILAGLAQMGYLYWWGLLRWRVGTLIIGLVWVMLILTLWREENN